MRETADGFQACLRAPFATLGITATRTHVTGIRYLAPSVAAKAPPRGTIAFLACVQIQAYLDNPSFAFDLPLAYSPSLSPTARGNPPKRARPPAQPPSRRPRPAPR